MNMNQVLDDIKKLLNVVKFDNSVTVMFFKKFLSVHDIS